MAKFTVLDLIDLEPERPNALDLRCLCGRKGLSREIYSTEINRPGMALTGFFERFVGERIQIIGRGEFAYIEETPKAVLSIQLDKLLSYTIPCFVFCYDLEPPRYFQEAADAAEIPLLITPLDSSALSIRLLRALDDVFAPQKTIHAALVDVEGMGVLIQGESGVGKSESALELLDRGHRLIADDSVLIKCLGGNVLWGYGTSKVMGHHMEIRGLGIIDIAQVYGLNSVRDSKPIEMVFRLEEWDSTKNYDRLGTSDETTEVLGVNIPLITLPVKPGRNIPIIIEAAVLNQRLKSKGVHAAKEFNKNLIQWIEKCPEYMEQRVRKQTRIGMTTRTVTILNRAGIHARPASLIVQAAQGYKCSIWLEKDSVKINAKSIMNILTLGATYQTEMVLGADGPDEEAAVAELGALFDNKFKEE